MTTKISGDNISSIGNTGLNWQAVTVADGSTTINVTSGNGYLLDTNAGVIEAFLPTSPSRGDTVVIADYSGTFATNRVIVNTGGVLIDSSATGDIQLTTNNSIVEFIYIDSSKGWLVKTNQAAGTTPSSALTGFSSSYDTISLFIAATGGTVTTDGDYKIHSFTGDGTFEVTNLSPTPANNEMDWTVIAGGGGGGGELGGGGGAGGYRESPGTSTGCYSVSPLAGGSSVTATITSYPITVGSGGAGSTCGPSPTLVKGDSGSPSIFSTITSAGGGGGGTNNSSPGGETMPGIAGGSGGGGAGSANNNGGGGAGNTPPVSPPQGNNGGTASLSAPNYGAAGGGGATAVGGGGTSTAGGAGGAGASTSITGSSVTRAGGGGGAVFGCGGTAGSGGTGGGGDGGNNTCGTNGTTNTGGGGGGARGQAGNGGSGIVIIRYKFQ